MSYKQFLDEDGIRWQVWEVIPEEAERRIWERRMLNETPPAEDRRDVLDRRQSGRKRSDLPPELLGGWLVFQSPQGKRRYWPIPPDWQTLSPAQLRELCRSATPVGRSGSGNLDDPPPRPSRPGSGV